MQREDFFYFQTRKHDSVVLIFFLQIEEPKRAYIFMVSGVTIESEKKRLFSCIRQLGATYADSVQYTPEASHLIVKFPVRNEKYLACCAAGKWVLHAKYLEDSVTAGHFLPVSKVSN
jgi:hypothetical protein